MSDQDRPIDDLVQELEALRQRVTDYTHLESLYNQALEQLTAAEKKYHDIIDHAVDGIFQATRDGGYLLINPSMARMLGYDSPEDLLKSMSNIQQQLYVEPERRAQLVQLLSENDTVSGFEAQVYRKDGQTIWISINARAVKDADGNTYYIEGTIEEITERVNAEAALKQSEERYRVLFGASTEAVFITSIDGKIVNVNQAAQDLFGFTEDNAIGSDVGDRFADPADGQRFREAMESSAVSRFGVRLLKKEGTTIDGEMSAARVLDETGAVVGVRGTFHETAGLRSAGESQVPDKSGGFTAAIARELERPLDTIANSARRLMRMNVDPAVRQHARAISAEATRTKNALDSLRLATYDQALEPGIVDINQLLASVITSFSRDSGLGPNSNTVLNFNPSPEAERVAGDPALLETVFKNLIENAREARDPAKRQVNVNIGCEKRDGVVRVAISDDGRGIAPAALGRVFEPFFTANSDGRKGMGLSVCRGIVKQHNGEISVESEVGKGSVVTVELPSAPAP